MSDDLRKKVLAYMESRIARHESSMSDYVNRNDDIMAMLVSIRSSESMLIRDDLRRLLETDK